MPYLADFILSFVSTDRLPIHLTSYVPGKTPFSTWPAVISMTVTYLAIIFGTRETMKDKPALKLTTLFRAHNLMLSIGSLILMSLICEEVVSIWLKPEIGTYGSLCASTAYTNVSILPSMPFDHDVELNTHHSLETGVLLDGELLLQVLRVYRHGILSSEEETPLWVFSFLIADTPL